MSQSRLELISRVSLISLCIVFPTICLIGCSDMNTTKVHLENTKLIYFGFDDHSEKQADVLRLAETWGGSKGCPHWRATVSEKDADYKVLFGTAIVTIVGHRGEVIYSGESVLCTFRTAIQTDRALISVS